MNRKNLILTAILALQLVIVAVVFWPRAADSSEVALLFPEMDTDQIVQIAITDGAGDSVELLKTQAGWVLPGADDYPSREEPISELLDKVTGLDTSRLIARTRSSQKRLKVSDDDFERRISLKAADGTEKVLFVGTSPSFGVAHVRAGGQDEVYLASELDAQDAGTGATSWVDRTFFQVDAAEIEGIEIDNSSGRIELEKKDGAWTLSGLQPDEQPDETAIQSLVNRVATISLNRPLGLQARDEYGLQTPSAEVTISTRDQDGEVQVHTLTFGAKDSVESGYVLSASNSPYFVIVSGFTGDNLADMTRQELLVLPPTPTPAP